MRLPGSFAGLHGRQVEGSLLRAAEPVPPPWAGLLTASADPGSHGPAHLCPGLQLAPESMPKEAGPSGPTHCWVRLRGN